DGRAAGQRPAGRRGAHHQYPSPRGVPSALLHLEGRGRRDLRARDRRLFPGADRDGRTPGGTPMKSLPFDDAAVRALAGILTETGLTEIEIEGKDGRIRGARAPAPVAAAMVAPPAVAIAAPPPVAA